jgi:probable rRNA maturation factor
MLGVFTMDRLTLEVLDETRRVPEAALSWMIGNAEKALRRLRCLGEVRVRIIADEAMASAHEEFAGVPGTTDVLTFDMSDPELNPERALPELGEIDSDSVRGPYVLDADIMVCIDEAERQAKLGGYPFERELLLYTLHGVLHCIGFDDHEEAAYVAMHAMEDAVLGAIGVGPVFHRPFVGDANPEQE